MWSSVSRPFKSRSGLHRRFTPDMQSSGRSSNASASGRYRCASNGASQLGASCPASSLRSLTSEQPQTYTRESPSSPTFSSPVLPPAFSRHNSDSKRIAALCQTVEASFITPYRNHLGHAGMLRSSRSRYVAAVLPIRSYCLAQSLGCLPDSSRIRRS